MGKLERWEPRRLARSIRRGIRRSINRGSRKGNAALRSTLKGGWFRVFAAVSAVGLSVALAVMALDQGPEILLWIGTGAFALGAVGLLGLFVHNYRAPLDVRFHAGSFPVIDVATVTMPGVGDFPEYVIILPNVMIESYESRPLTLRCELHIQEKEDGSGQVCQSPYHRPSLPDGSPVIGQPVKLDGSGSHERGGLAFTVGSSSFFRDRIRERPNWEKAACHLSLWLIDERSTKARKFDAGYFVGAALPTLQSTPDIEVLPRPRSEEEGRGT